MTTETQSDDPLPKRLEMVYKDALDQIAFLKKQQWVVVGYGIAVHAALFTIANQIKPLPENRKVLIGLAVLAALYGISLLWGFKGGMAKFRARLDWLYQNQFDEHERSGLKLGQARSASYEWPFFGGLSITLVISAVVAGYAVWSVPQ